MAVDRRRFFSAAVITALTATLPGRAVPRSKGDESATAGRDITGRLAEYMVSAHGRALPAEVLAAGKLRILDTFAAMVSGSRLKPGIMAAEYTRQVGGKGRATVIGSAQRTNAVAAAFANGMCAHADETDDFEPVTKAHPGCSAVPAALAMAEENAASGEAFIRAVALGYDLGCRLLLALGPDLVRRTNRSAEGISSTFCALGAAAPLARLDERHMRYAISYAAQQVSGLWSWVNDEQHVEKAFDFAGMGSRNGVMAVTMVESGMTGTPNVLDGAHNLFIAESTAPHPEAMLQGLGSRFYVTETAIKPYSVGYPCQSALDALLALRRDYRLGPGNVRSVIVRLPTDAVGIVGNSAMPDVNCPYLIAVALLKGAVSFADSHDASLMTRPDVLAVRRRITILGDAALMDPMAPRGAIVEVTLSDGRRVSHHTRFPPGTPQNPLSIEVLDAKARDLMTPVLGAARTEQLIGRLHDLEKLEDMRRLHPLLTA